MTASTRAGSETITEPGAPAEARPVDRWLIQTLLDAGSISDPQASELRAARGPSIWQAAVERGFLTDEQILDHLAARFKVAIADLSTVDSRVATLLPESIARKYLIVAVGADDRVIRVAASDPRDLSLEQTLMFVTGRDVVMLAAAPSAIAAKLDEIYRPAVAVNRLVGGLQPASVETVDEGPRTPDPDRDPSLEAPMARLVDAMIADAVREKASDIHCEPLVECTSVRYRIDGVMKEVIRLPPSAGPALVRRVKILSKLDVTDPLRPHDGRTAVRVDGVHVDLRVSTVPVARRGEKVVIRILDKTNLRANIPDLHLPPAEESLLLRMLGHREGIILVTGPTGSGKTTTLYAGINHLKTGAENIVTVEDPVEYDVPGISQLQVSEAQNFTFATALRSVLRQDPDIVLVGEIRDGETAGIAVQAGLSGHLVLSTLHTNDAPTAVVRLRDLGVDGFKIAAVLKGVVAQRLVRLLCDGCAIPVPNAELPPEARPPAAWRGSAIVRRAVGCKACGGTGFRGRLAVMEMMPIDEEVSQLIAAGATPDALVAAARPHGMRTLWEGGLERLWRGQTSLEELIRVMGEHPPDDAAAPSPARPATELPGPTPVPAPPADGRVPEGAAKTRVLIADDDAQMRRLIRMILERDDHEVTEANDGLDALDLIESRSFDLMILDLDMPRLDGFGVLDELRARVLTSSVPVIVLTAHTGESEVRVLDLGAQDFLAKPVQPQSLLARVRAVLRRTRMA